MSFRNIEENRGSKREASAFSFSPLLERSSSKQATPASGCTTEGRRKQGKRLLFYNIVFYLLLRQKPRTQRCCLLCCLLTCYSTIWPEIKSWPLVLVCNAMQHQTCCNSTRPSILTWKVSVYIEHIVWKLLKMSHFYFWIWAFSTIFCPIKADLSGNTVWLQASGFQKIPKMDPFGIFN